MRAKKAKAIRKALRRKDAKEGVELVGTPVKRGSSVVYHFTYRHGEESNKALYKLGKKIYRASGLLPREVLDDESQSRS